MSRKMDPNTGQRVTGYGRTPEEADADLNLKLSTASIATVETFHDAAKFYWHPSLTRVKPLTKKRYEGAYRTHVRAVLGHRPPSEIKSSEVQRLINGMEAKGASSSSCATVRSVITQILRHCELNDMVTRNAAAPVSVPKAAPKRVRVLTVDQAATLLDSVAGTSLAAPVFLASILGLCRGEVCALRWDDLDRQRGELNIWRQRIHGTGSTEDAELKRDARNRVLRLTPSLIEQIDQRGDLDSPYICTHAGKRWAPNTLTRRWAEFAAEEGNEWLSDWHFHDLRHGAAGLLYAAGCDILQICAVLGHAKPDMSLIYTDMSDRHRKEAVEKLSEMLAFK